MYQQQKIKTPTKHIIYILEMENFKTNMQRKGKDEKKKNTTLKNQPGKIFLSDC